GRMPVDFEGGRRSRNDFQPPQASRRQGGILCLLASLSNLRFGVTCPTATLIFGVCVNVALIHPTFSRDWILKVTLLPQFFIVEKLLAVRLPHFAISSEFEQVSYSKPLTSNGASQFSAPYR